MKVENGGGTFAALEKKIYNHCVVDEQDHVVKAEVGNIYSGHTSVVGIAALVF